LRAQSSAFLSFSKFLGYATQEASQVIISRVEELAKKKNVTMAQIAVAWHLHKEGESLTFFLRTFLTHYYY
jgi:aryl-alcohol dehydrogenase-like predicted oxidoreductase